jgi:ABC-type transport system involved in multi-copper enzyme maturation permease subunit
MKKIWAIAINTFREAIRNKVLYSLLLFALLVIVASLAFGSMSVRDRPRLTMDLGLAGMSLFSVIIAIFVGVNLVYKELERKTVYTLIPKPMHRYQFVFGKYLGLVLTMGVQLAIMSGTLAVVLTVADAPVGAPLAMMTLLILFEVLVITAVAVFFSSFSTPLLSGMFTVGIFLLGRSVPDIRLVARSVNSDALQAVLDGLSRVVPNLRHFFVTGTTVDERYVSVNGVFVDWGYVGAAAAYAGLYTALVLLGAAALFSRRDFT